MLFVEMHDTQFLSHTPGTNILLWVKEPGYNVGQRVFLPKR